MAFVFVNYAIAEFFKKIDAKANGILYESPALLKIRIIKIPFQHSF